jgi:hypothetical protein
LHILFFLQFSFFATFYIYAKVDIITKGNIFAKVFLTMMLTGMNGLPVISFSTICQQKLKILKRSEEEKKEEEEEDNV